MRNWTRYIVSEGFAAPQQALAYHHHNHNKDIKVDQQISQANLCTNNQSVLTQGITKQI
jgi:hypothetical protein